MITLLDSQVFNTKPREEILGALGSALAADGNKIVTKEKENGSGIDSHVAQMLSSYATAFYNTLFPGRPLSSPPAVTLDGVAEKGVGAVIRVALPGLNPLSIGFSDTTIAIYWEEGVTQFDRSMLINEAVEAALENLRLFSPAYPSRNFALSDEQRELSLRIMSLAHEMRLTQKESMGFDNILFEDASRTAAFTIQISAGAENPELAKRRERYLAILTGAFGREVADKIASFFKKNEAGDLEIDLWGILNASKNKKIENALENLDFRRYLLDFLQDVGDLFNLDLVKEVARAGDQAYGQIYSIVIEDSKGNGFSKELNLFTMEVDSERNRVTLGISKKGELHYTAPKLAYKAKVFTNSGFERCLEGQAPYFSLKFEHNDPKSPITHATGVQITAFDGPDFSLTPKFVNEHFIESLLPPVFLGSFFKSTLAALGINQDSFTTALEARLNSQEPPSTKTLITALVEEFKQASNAFLLPGNTEVRLSHVRFLLKLLGSARDLLSLGKEMYKDELAAIDTVLNATENPPAHFFVALDTLMDKIIETSLVEEGFDQLTLLANQQAQVASADELASFLGKLLYLRSRFDLPDAIEDLLPQVLSEAPKILPKFDNILKLEDAMGLQLTPEQISLVMPEMNLIVDLQLHVDTIIKGIPKRVARDALINTQKQFLVDLKEKGVNRAALGLIRNIDNTIRTSFAEIDPTGKSVQSLALLKATDGLAMPFIKRQIQENQVTEFNNLRNKYPDAKLILLKLDVDGVVLPVRAHVKTDVHVYPHPKKQGQYKTTISNVSIAEKIKVAGRTYGGIPAVIRQEGSQVTLQFVGINDKRKYSLTEKPSIAQKIGKGLFRLFSYQTPLDKLKGQMLEQARAQLQKAGGDVSKLSEPTHTPANAPDVSASKPSHRPHIGSVGSAFAFVFASEEFVFIEELLQFFI